LNNLIEQDHRFIKRLVKPGMGFFSMEPAGRTAPLYGNLAVADSLVADPHKWLAAPIGCGAVFVRDGKLMERA